MLLFREKALSMAALLLIILLVLTSSLVLLTMPAEADVVPAQISSYRISPKPDGYLIAGATNYSIEFTLDIAKGVEGNIVLETQLEKSGTNYWELLTPGYQGVPSDWQPGQKSISFDAVAGTPTFKLNGYVPEDMTTTIMQNPFSGTVTLHQPGTLSIVSLSLSSGEILGMIPSEEEPLVVIDDSLLRYNDALKKKDKALSENSGLAREIEAMAKAGDTEQATALLETLPGSGWGSDSGSLSTIMYIVAAVLAIIAILAIILLLRGRGTVAFLKQRASDQANKLDIVESRIHKLGEKSLTSDIAQIRDTLKEMGRR